MTTRDTDAAAGGSRSTQPGQKSGDAEPDYRFTLANERTFLAWLRTSLGLVAAGVAVSQLPSGTGVSADGRRVLAIFSVSLGLIAGFGSLRRWSSVRAAMRQGRPLPHPLLVPVLAGGLVLIAIVALALVIAD
jgi:putative membrane protein